MKTLALVLTLLLALPAAAETLTGKVVGVMDGDTVKILVVDGAKKTPVKIRLWGVDCPEKKQAFGQKAKEFTSNMVFGKQVECLVKSHDRYGRTVATVAVAGDDLGLALLKAGLAWWYQHYAKHAADYQAAEATARVNKAGLWADPNPKAPWDWRNNKGARQGAR